jgi:hypothetical protein
MYSPLDGPSSQIKKIGVTSTTVVEAKVLSSTLEDRKVVTLQPTGNIRVYFGDGSSIPSAATVLANGVIQYKDQMISYEAGQKQPMFFVAVAGTVDVIVIERA